MKVLYLVPYVPDLIRVRPYQLIRALSDRGHHVTVMTLWTNELERHAAENLKSICDAVYAFRLPSWRTLLNLVSALPGSTPLQASYCWEPTLFREVYKRIVSDGAKDFDIIHVEHLRGVRYGLALKSAMNNGSTVPIVWDSVDCISYLFEQAVHHSAKGRQKIILNFDLQRTRKYEGKVSRQFDRVLITSRIDYEKMAALPGASPENFSILPNGVDLDYFQPGPFSGRSPNSLVISGKMSYHANVAMVQKLVNEIMPLVWQSRPDVKVCVVGKDPPVEIQAMSQDSRITVTGTVSDLRPYLQNAAISVAPIAYGAGIQNKVLEAMACATPVIASSKAVSALNITAGEDLLLADSPEEFAFSINHLLDNSPLREKIGLSGRAFVERNHCWPIIGERLEQIYTQVLAEKNSDQLYL